MVFDLLLPSGMMKTRSFCFALLTLASAAAGADEYPYTRSYSTGSRGGRAGGAAYANQTATRTWGETRAPRGGWAATIQEGYAGNYSYSRTIVTSGTPDEMEALFFELHKLHSDYRRQTADYDRLTDRYNRKYHPERYR